MQKVFFRREIGLKSEMEGKGRWVRLEEEEEEEVIEAGDVDGK